MNNMEDSWSTSHTSGGQSSYLESLYESYLSDPSSIPNDWKLYFDSLPVVESEHEEVSHQEVIDRLKETQVNTPLRNALNQVIQDERQVRVIQLIQAYRNRGHQKARLDPLGLKIIRHCDDLDLEFHGLHDSDLSEVFNTDTLKINQDSATLKEILKALEHIYCGTLGIEYNYISSMEERVWFQQRLEPNLGNLNFNHEEKKYILKRLSSAEGLAKFLASRYPGMKRFGIDGSESLIPLVDSLIQNCGIFGAEQVCFGMAHRGRLNLLVNVLGKSPKELFKEF
jgi:2-oxoglutarate dehydrogenase E1 component